jgi:hypothetical protein
MANPLWKIGTSGNPEGRPRHSVRTVKGMVERFVKKNVTPNKLQKMYDTLTEQQKLNMLTELLPYVAAKVPTEGLSNADIDTLYDRITQSLKPKQDAAKAS